MTLTTGEIMILDDVVMSYRFSHDVCGERVEITATVSGCQRFDASHKVSFEMLLDHPDGRGIRDGYGHIEVKHTQIKGADDYAGRLDGKVLCAFGSGVFRWHYSEVRKLAIASMAKAIKLYEGAQHILEAQKAEVYK